MSKTKRTISDIRVYILFDGLHRWCHQWEYELYKPEDFPYFFCFNIKVKYKSYSDLSQKIRSVVKRLKYE